MGSPHECTTECVHTHVFCMMWGAHCSTINCMLISTSLYLKCIHNHYYGPHRYITMLVVLRHCFSDGINPGRIDHQLCRRCWMPRQECFCPIEKGSTTAACHFILLKTRNYICSWNSSNLHHERWHEHFQDKVLIWELTCSCTLRAYGRGLREAMLRVISQIPFGRLTWQGKIPRIFRSFTLW